MLGLNSERAKSFDWCLIFATEYIVLLLQENPDLWKWLTGQEQPPEAVSINPVRHLDGPKIGFPPDSSFSYKLHAYVVYLLF